MQVNSRTVDERVTNNSTHSKPRTLSSRGWETLIRLQKTSKLSQMDFCKENNITVGQLNYQKKKLLSQFPLQPSKVLPVLVKHEEDRSDPATKNPKYSYVIESFSGRRIFVSDKFCPLSLKKLLSVLEGN